MTPLVSVLMPVYDGQRYLSSSVESILGQSYRDFEFIIIDDGSNDSSLSILNGYAEADSRIKLISRENKGLVQTLNEGIGLARGSLVARMDADDISYPTRFERQINYLKNNPDCVVVGSKAMLIDADGDPICEYSRQCDHESIDNEHMAGRGGSICHPAAMFRKDSLIRVGGYCQEYEHAEDLDLFLRLAEVGRLANIPEVLFEYRQHLASIGYTKRILQRDSANRAVSDAHRRRGLTYHDVATIQTPEKEPSLAEIHSKWAWWALSAGNIGTSRKHAYRALMNGAVNIETLKLFACIVRGH
jgi:glycosyltransferase involved in cell wall biosynthesis